MSLPHSPTSHVFLLTFLKCFLHFNLSSVIEDRSANVLTRIEEGAFIYKNINMEHNN